MTQNKPTQANPPNASESNIARIANRLVLGIARHWLALFNLAWGTYVLLPFVAPVLMFLGLEMPARLFIPSIRLCAISYLITAIFSSVTV